MCAGVANENRTLPPFHRKISTDFSYFFSLVLVIWRPSRGAQHAAVASAVKRGAMVTPFTLETQLLLVDEQSPYIGLTMQLTARRADGATVMLAYRPGASGYQTHIRTIAYTDGRRIEVLDKFHVVTNWPP